MGPSIAWVLGDPAGIGPELVAKSLVSPEMLAVCRPVVVGPAWLLEQGKRVAQVQVTASVCTPDRLGDGHDGTVPLVDTGWPPREFPPGKLSAEAGRLTIEMLRVAVDLAQAGKVEAIVFGPLNKEALHLGGNPHNDELHLLAEWLGDTDICEINAAADLITTRVTSHVPLKDVPSLISGERILRAVRMLHRTLTRAGIVKPRIGVAALNPHAGEHGLCGTEEVEVIGPAVQQAREQGMLAEGPFPADTIFLRARREDFRGVLTMYHDQGQIATKLLGFDHGVTVQGGLSIPITTPAHGTAFDIAGKGIANPGAFQAAVRLAAQMATSKEK